jgi:hypothetical protein
VERESQPNAADDRSIALAGLSLIASLRESFPRFEQEWLEHLAFWHGETAGPYNDINVFAHFIVDELFVHQQYEEGRRAFLLLDQLFLVGDDATRDLIGIGFIEDLGNITSNRADGHTTIIPYLPPTLHEVWKIIDNLWAGHHSLAEVLRWEAAHSSGDEGQHSTLGSLWKHLPREDATHLQAYKHLT